MMSREHREERILAFIGEYFAKRGYYPSVREIAASLGLSSPSYTHKVLCEMAKAGRVRRLQVSHRLSVFALPEGK